MQRNRNLLFIGLILVAMFSRLIPHAPNFTALTAAGLFAGFAFNKDMKSFLVPLIALWFSDLVINNTLYLEFYGGFTLFTDGFGWIYGGMLLSVLIGRYGIKKISAGSVLFGSVSAAMAFFLVTNLGAWLANPVYPQTPAGLLTAYTAGLPFLLNQILSTILFGAILFGAAYAYKTRELAQRVHA